MKNKHKMIEKYIMQQMIAEELEAFETMLLNDDDFVMEVKLHPLITEEALMRLLMLLKMKG
ncbi:MAG: hypothetical protein ABIJ16_05010 [Bacteroidota bacterium]